MGPIAVDGHRVVLILIQKDEAGNVLDDQHAMRTGEAHWDGDALWLDWGEADPPYALDPDWFERIKPLAISMRPDPPPPPRSQPQPGILYKVGNSRCSASSLGMSLITMYGWCGWWAR